jgi:hypothetical protein
MAENHHPAPSQPPPAPFDLSRRSAAFLLAALILFFYRRLLSGQITWLNGDDTAFQVLPWLQFQASEWRHWTIPLWDPNHWFGQPLLAQAQPGVANPLNWLLFLAPLHLGWLRNLSLNFWFCFIHLLAAACAYRLARSLGCRRLASIPGALLFSLAGWFGVTFWPQMLSSAVWAPLVLLFLMRALKRRSPVVSASLSGFFLGLCFLGGHHQVPIFLAVACLLCWLPFLLSRPRLILACSAFCAMAAATSAVQVLPAREYGRLALRWVGAPEPIGWDQRVPYDIHHRYSLLPASLPGIVLPRHTPQSEPFLGFTGALLALLALLRWRRFEVRFLAAFALLGLLLALGGHTFFHRLLYQLIPHFDKARSPLAATLLFGLAASMLAAAGLDVLLSRLPALRLALPLTLILSALILREVSAVNLVFAPRLPESARLSSLLALGRDAGLAAFLRSQPGLYRASIDASLIPYNFGDWYGIPQTGGYLASLTTNVYRARPHETWNQRLLGVRYAISAQPTSFHRDLVYRSNSGPNIYENIDVFPRAFSVHEAIFHEKAGEIPDQLFLLAGRLDRATILPTPPPPLDRCPAPDSVQILSYHSSTVRLAARMACRGMVILSDTWYPGWRAYVDGRPAPIHKAYGFLRGVVVPAGAHTLDFRYRPASVYRGAALSLAAFAAFCFLAFPRLRFRLH